MILNIALGIVVAVVILRVMRWIVAVIISNNLREKPIEQKDNLLPGWIALGVVLACIGTVVWHSL